jgi:Dyp-type peroxidase family
MAPKLDLDDIQGIVTRGYRDLRAATYLLLRIGDPALARAWLDTIAAEVTTAQVNPTASAVNVACTPSGLQRLGLASDALAAFSLEFTGGMATLHRSRMLGDQDDSAPERWSWGGPDNEPVDILLALYASDWTALATLYDSHASRFAPSGLEQVAKLETSDLGDVEHFGFRDGVSQPVIEGIPIPSTPANTIKAGEFLLGYPNEYGLYTDRPLLPRAADPANILPLDAAGSDRADLGRNGAYLVFRQLRQDVRGFWRFLDAATKQPDGTSDAAARVRLAARMVGRWQSGAPLVQAPETDNPSLATFNDFAYFQTDAEGIRCPIGAHIRRSNPRDSLDPNPGSAGSISVGKRHRIIRRGREYGKPVPTDELLSALPHTEDDERGLHFLCVTANIARQFEFIQHTWVNNPKFDRLYDDADPLLGVHGLDGATFTVQATPVRQRVTSLPRFVTVRGGAYFFLPGIRALRYLAHG